MNNFPGWPSPSRASRRSLKRLNHYPARGRIMPQRSSRSSKLFRSVALIASFIFRPLVKALHSELKQSSLLPAYNRLDNPRHEKNHRLVGLDVCRSSCCLHDCRGAVSVECLNHDGGRRHDDVKLCHNPP